MGCGALMSAAAKVFVDLEQPWLASFGSDNFNQALVDSRGAM